MNRVMNNLPGACCFVVLAVSLVLGPLAPGITAAQRSTLAGGAVFEAEVLGASGKIIIAGGKAAPQQMSGFGPGWSGNAQLIWVGGQPGAVLDLIVDVPTRAVYSVDLFMTRAPDYGRLRIQVDGKDAAATFDGYAPSVVPSGPFKAGSFDLGPGQRKVSFMIIGKNDKATGLLVGIDAILLRSVSQTQSLHGQLTVESSQNLAQFAMRTTLEIWDGLQSVDHAPLKYGTEAVTNLSKKSWVWSFRWSTTVPGGKSAVLVGTSQAPSPSDPPLASSNLVGQKQVPDGVPPPGVMREFSMDIGQWVLPPPQAMTSGPGSRRIYIRIVLLDGNGQPVGPPSRLVTLTRDPKRQPDLLGEAIKTNEKLKAETEAMKAKASVYEVKILAHKPVTFPADSQLGCIVVLKNPYYVQSYPGQEKPSSYHPLAFYKPGETYCPKKDPQFYEKGTGDWILTGLGGWIKAYEGLAQFYSDAKNYVASKIADETCEWLGKKLESDCEAAVRQVVGNAMSAGLAAAGVPPTLPDLAALGDMAEGKIVDVAVDYSCKAFENNGGVCTPEMRKKLATLYTQAFDKLRAQIKRQGKEPDCGSKEIAKNSMIPLPCFTDYPGTDVKPAPGSIYEPSTVTVRVTRVKPDPDFPMPNCSVSANVYLKDYFEGATLGGVTAKPGWIEGDAFVPAHIAIPPLPLGKSGDMTLVFTQVKQLNLPGIHDPVWGYAGWKHLYIGGKGSLYAGLSTDQSVKLPDGLSTKIACGQGDKWSVEIPKK